VRILYFSRTLTSHDHRFLSSLAGTGHEVFHLMLEQDPSPVEESKLPGKIARAVLPGRRASFSWPDLPRRLAGLRRTIREFRPDLVHAGPIQTCAFLAALAGFRPLLAMSWGYDLLLDADRSAWSRWITRFTLRRSAYFVSDCETTRSRAIAFGMRAERTSVFPWGLDLQHFQPAGRSSGSPGEFVLFCNRSFEPIYGVDLLARAFVEAAREIPEARLLLLGRGSLEPELRRIFDQAGVGGRVTFAGHISQQDLPRYYHMADLYISPSHVDGSSVSLMEALACGLPCLVSDIPGNREWIENDRNGWLYRDGDPASLAERIVWIARNRDRLPATGRAGRQTAEQRADWGANFPRLLEAYVRTVETHA
jgi:glycosyltransferase involved in cell wall biosynthesis